MPPSRSSFRRWKCWLQQATNEQTCFQMRDWWPDSNPNVDYCPARLRCHLSNCSLPFRDFDIDTSTVDSLGNTKGSMYLTIFIMDNDNDRYCRNERHANHSWILCINSLRCAKHEVFNLRWSITPTRWVHAWPYRWPSWPLCIATHLRGGPGCAWRVSTAA